MSLFNPDYVEMLDALSAANAKFLLVGAFALSRHGLSRSTGDMDVWVEPAPENAVRVWQALLRFGAPLANITVADLNSPELVFQIGIAPRRIDILTTIDGVSFPEAWETRTEWEYEGRKYPVIGRESLIKNKRAVGRLKDLADVEWLEKHGE